MISSRRTTLGNRTEELLGVRDGDRALRLSDIEGLVSDLVMNILAGKKGFASLGLDALEALAFKDQISVPGDIDATGTADGTTFLRGDGAWAGVDAWGQKYSVVSRAVDTTYQNTTGRPISVGFSVFAGGGSAQAAIKVSDTITMPANPTVGINTPAGGRATVWARVPPGHYYVMGSAGPVSSSYFMELS